MIACHSKNIEYVKNNSWTHLYNEHIYWFAKYYTNENKLLWGIGVDRDKTILNKDVSLEAMGYDYIVDLGTWKHFDQKVQSKFDALVWVNLDNENIHDVSGKLYSISGFKQELKNMGISWTLTKCTKFFAMSVEEKIKEVAKLQKTIEHVQMELDAFETTISTPPLYEALMKVAPKPLPVYAWVLRNGIVVKEPVNEM